MRIRGQAIKPLLVGMALAAISMLGLVASTPDTVQAQGPMKIEVVMKDGAYKVSGHTVAGALTQIVIKNEDTIEHGFTSPLLDEVTVRAEGEGIALEGKGVKAYHICPGKTLTLNFTKFSKEEPETQRFVFWCDLHPNMKGELFIVETKGEVGGG